jgi:hypothetical protein
MTSYPVAVPTSPGFQKVVINPKFASSMTQSPFSGAQQSYDFGGMWWTAQCTLPPMSRAQAAAWKAFLLTLHGTFGTFTMGKAVDSAPRGTATAALADGAGTIRTNSLVVDGLGALQTLLKGDYFSFNNRLYMLTADTTADGGGNGTLTFAPPLRDPVPDDSVLVLSNPQGTWRMASAETGWTDDQMLVTAITFACLEAL